MEKQCTKCGNAKDEGEFRPRHKQCRECEREALRKRYAENPEKYRNLSKKWYYDNQQRANERDRKKYAEDPDKYRERQRIARLKDPEKFRKAQRSRYKNNPSRQREASRRYHQENRDECVRKMRSRYVADPETARRRGRDYYAKDHAKNSGRWNARNAARRARKHDACVPEEVADVAKFRKHVASAKKIGCYWRMPGCLERRGNVPK